MTYSEALTYAISNPGKKIRIVDRGGYIYYQRGDCQLLDESNITIPIGFGCDSEWEIAEEPKPLSRVKVVAFANTDGYIVIAAENSDTHSNLKGSHNWEEVELDWGNR